MELLGTKIQALRRNKNLTQAQLAEALSVSAQSVSKWENHLSSPDISLLPVIARYFGITMDELFNYRLDALNYKERFIRFMADNGVLQFGEFRLQSGRVSPYYINTGNYKSASQIAKLGEFYAECIREHNVDTNLLVGNTLGETPIVIATSMVLFNRYGMDIQYHIEDSVGKPLESSDKVVLLKDTLTSGDTLRDNLRVIELEAGKCVSGIIVAVDRMEAGVSSSRTARSELEREKSIKIHSIVNLEDIIRAVGDGIVGSGEHLDSLKAYYERYGGK